MYNDIYEEPKNTIEISLVQVFLIAIIVLGTFVIPAQAISSINSTQSVGPVYTASALRGRDEDGRVAGIETSQGTTAKLDTKSITLPIVNYTVDITTETGILVLSGTVLLIFALMSLIYLLLSSPEHKKRKR